MKHSYTILWLITLILAPVCHAWAVTTRFAVLTDTHVSAPVVQYDTLLSADTLAVLDAPVVEAHTFAGEAEQALALCAEDMKSQGLSFVLHAGDMTENGDSLSLRSVRALLESTGLPYYVTSGNHETTWSKSALMDLRAVFDSVRFAQNINGMLFLGMNSGPILRMSEGHISPADTLWARQWLDSLGMQPTFVVTHYPLQNGDVDNWYDLTNLLRQYNTQVIISGHHHRNKHLVVDGIDDIVCRTSLPDDDISVYTIVEVTDDSIRFFERSLSVTRDESTQPVTLKLRQASTRQWASLPLGRRSFAMPDTTLLPSYAVNDSDSLIVPIWKRTLPVSFYASPVENYGRIYIGDDNGTFYAFDKDNGKILWRYKTTRRIVGTAAVKDGRVVFGSANGYIYCLSVEQGRLLWRVRTPKPVTGSVTIDGNNVYVGSSDSCLYAIKLLTGAPVWTYKGFGDYCIAKPLVYKNKLYVGAWDGYFYAFDKRKGTLLWRWNNGKTNRKLSPAAVWPCADNQRVYIVAPDRYLTALNADSGTVSMRTNRWQVRESLGMQDSLLFAKTMHDTIIAINLKADTLLWATDAGFGYEHAPTQLMAKDTTLFVTTKNGLITALHTHTGEILWQHKIGNSLLGTPCALTSTDVVVSSTDGTIARIGKREPILPDTTQLYQSIDSTQKYYLIDTIGPFGSSDTLHYHLRDTLSTPDTLPVDED